MVTQDKELQTIGGATTTNTSFYGLSTDNKPAGAVGNGSCFIEMDTGKAYFYNAAGNAWVEA